MEPPAQALDLRLLLPEDRVLPRPGPPPGLVGLMPVYWEVFLDGAGDELGRLAGGPSMKTIAEMETALLTGFSITEERVHVITGELKASGHPSSHHDEYTWEGTISFARDPGIFELARGNSPTRYHPMGGHYFFDPGGPIFERGVRQAIWDWVTDGKGGDAPAGGLGPWSGGPPY